MGDEIPPPSAALTGETFMSQPLTLAECRPLLDLALEAAIAGAEAIMEVRARGFEVDYKSDGSPLTDADRAAHRAIGAVLGRGDLPVLSEESRTIPHADRADWARFWLVDPLDGTKEFARRNGDFTVNIAVVEEGRPVLGVVLTPVHDQVHWGIAAADGCVARRTGAWRGLTVADLHARAEDLAPMARKPAPPLRVVASRSHRNQATEDFIAALKDAYGDVDLVSRGSALKLCMVAEGAADIYPRVAPTSEWDTAAPHAIVRAVGGEVWIHDPAVAPAAYLDADPAAHGLTPVRYNKEDLLNPYFVVS
jgi:3'(2'), 5'-bisphosphate nucleotidase